MGRPFCIAASKGADRRQSGFTTLVIVAIFATNYEIFAKIYAFWRATQ
jgi:hypothetical protein